LSSLSFDCPHCGAKSAAFLLIRSAISQTQNNIWHAMGACGVCKEVVLFRLWDIHLNVQTRSAIDPIAYGKESNLLQRFSIIDAAPKNPTPIIPTDLPANVEAPFVEAEAALGNKLLSSAASCYRKSIERAVKFLHPDGKGMLNARIREMDKLKLLPEALIALLDQVRILGNFSIHEEIEDPSLEDCEAVKIFATLFLTYTFSLPAQVENAKLRMAASAP
jgi:hypothetical protein